MFSLPADCSSIRILDCGAGPASFAAEATALGWSVVAVDPLYEHSPAELRARIDASYDKVVALAARNAHRFVWSDRIPSPQALGAVRRSAMERFLEDYERLEKGRYLFGSLPRLPFADAAFDLALCSHLLFLYSHQFDLDFHVAALVELARVAREVACSHCSTSTGSGRDMFAVRSMASSESGWKSRSSRSRTSFSAGATRCWW